MAKMLSANWGATLSAMMFSEGSPEDAGKNVYPPSTVLYTVPALEPKNATFHRTGSTATLSTFGKGIAVAVAQFAPALRLTYRPDEVAAYSTFGLKADSATP